MYLRCPLCGVGHKARLMLNVDEVFLVLLVIIHMKESGIILISQNGKPQQ